MVTKVSIIGGAGYGAAELLRHLISRDDVEILKVSSKDYIGQTVERVHRSLWGRANIVIEDVPPRACAEGADIVFLAMPHVVTARVAMELFDKNVRIIDLSGDFRLQLLEHYIRDYAPEHPCPDRLGTFVYGLPEINAEKIKKARHVACPGCFATAIALGLLPLAKTGALDGLPVRTVGITGSSGSGISPQPSTHHPTRSNNLKAYKILSHQHCSETVQTLEAAGARGVSLDFVPVSAPLARGILAVSQMDLPAGHDRSSLMKLYGDYYQHNELISIMPADQCAEVVAVAGSARVEIGIDTNKGDGPGSMTLCCTTAIDNLIKGGAGQAIQNFNLMTGKPMNYRLDSPGLWP
jgi:N-acetyl-gamma-glutamyl-phosphate reductase